ncbi:MAG: hypothetical protein ACKOPR_08960, partial [Chakrabartia godavariana]
MEVKVGEGERAYFNGAIRTVETESSVLISSSKYLNNAELRNLIAQEMLRRNGLDLPSTAFIPEVAQLLMSMEDYGRIMELFEIEKARLPEFRRWCDDRSLSDFEQLHDPPIIFHRHQQLRDFGDECGAGQVQ